MEDQYWLETSCRDCSWSQVHSMTTIPNRCPSCEGVRLAQRMIRESVIDRVLQKHAAGATSIR